MVDHILTGPFIEHRCNVCGGSYRMTLYDLLQESKSPASRAGRPPSTCHAEFDSYVASVPIESLRELDRAWAKFARALPDSLDVQIPKPPGVG